MMLVEIGDEKLKTKRKGGKIRKEDNRR